MRDSDRPVLRAEPDHGAGGPDRTTREWLDAADAEMRSLLPSRRRPTMTTSRMVDDQGRTRDVYAYFDRCREKMQGVTSNWWALQHTAQAIEHATVPLTPSPWRGFDRVLIPVSPRVQYAGFLGLARREGKIIDADCIVVLPGLWGDNGARRSRDVSDALIRSGLHVLSVEPRGHGLTHALYPDVPYTFGVLETPDLMKVSEWLQDTYPQVRRTGLMGFCWGANAALLAAWYDGRRADDPSLSEHLRRVLGPPSSRRHYEAGVLGFSPVLNWEAFLDRMDTPQSQRSDLAAHMFQSATRDHMTFSGAPEASGSLRLCIAYDFSVSELGRSFPLSQGYDFLRLMPYRGLPAGNKLDFARMPVLVVHAVNDPLMNAQEVPDLILQTRNPQVAGLVLPGGGHIAFQAWSRRYFYNLVLRFFDPVTGPSAPSP